jgi:hypothetical protein
MLKIPNPFRGCCNIRIDLVHDGISPLVVILSPEIARSQSCAEKPLILLPQTRIFDNPLEANQLWGDFCQDVLLVGYRYDALGNPAVRW